jgi:hypothetical protein
MTEAQTLALFFVGVASGSLSPTRWTFLVSMSIAVIFMIINLYLEIYNFKRQRKGESYGIK